MNGTLLGIWFYGAILAAIFFRVRKRTHSSRNVWVNTAILSVGLVIVAVIWLLIIMGIGAYYPLGRNKIVTGFGVGAIVGSWAVLWQWLMRRFEQPKKPANPPTASV